MGEFQNLRSSEVAVVELNDGRVMLNSRSPGAERYRTVGISNDGGVSFKQCNSYVDKQLFEAPGGVQGSLLNVEGKILFQILEATKRERITVFKLAKIMD